MYGELSPSPAPQMGFSSSTEPHCEALRTGPTVRASRSITCPLTLTLPFLCLQVNAVVLCRVVMVTVSSARRRAKMLSPSSASKMQTFDLTW